MANVFKAFWLKAKLFVDRFFINRRIKRLVSNLKNIDAISAKSLNVYDLLKRKYIVVEKEAIKEIESYGHSE